MFKVKRITGPLFKQRLEVKGFKTNEARDKFMLDNEYSLCNPTGWHMFDVDPTSRDNLAPGTYVYAGQKWINVKKLDPSALAHL